MAGEPSGESFLLGPDLPLPARAGEPSGESFLIGPDPAPPSTGGGAVGGVLPYWA